MSFAKYYRYNIYSHFVRAEILISAFELKASKPKHF